MENSNDRHIPWSTRILAQNREQSMNAVKQAGRIVVGAKA